ncbi:MAG: ethylbenzene dehydrogenase-related protein [Acidimicrobiia bacterium]
MRRRHRLSAIISLLLIAGLMRVWDANPAIAQTQSIGAWRVSSDPGLDGSSPAWQSILPVIVPTTAQQVTPPMGGGTVARIAVRALHWEDRLYVMLEWADSTSDLVADRPEAFTDAAAIQFPAVAGSTVPAICMGQADQAVNIWQWRADQQQAIPGLPEDGYVDLYPSDDDLFYTAREAGNPLAQEARRPVRNLVAGGFGTLTATESTSLEGSGIHAEGRWMVVFSRPLTPDGPLQPEFSGEVPVDVAFAVWDGSQGQRDGIKSVSAFTQLTITPEDPPRGAVPALGEWPAYRPPSPMIGFLVFALVPVMAVGVLIWFMTRREPDDEES